MDADERFIKELVVASVGKCVACGCPYDPDSVTVLGHQENLWFLMIACRSCSSYGLVAAVMKESRPPAMIDLTPGDLARLHGAGPVTADDVLDVHEFLKDFDGDFARLFGHRQRPKNL